MFMLFCQNKSIDMSFFFFYLSLSILLPIPLRIMFVSATQT